MNRMKKLKDINWNQVYYFYEVARKLSMKEAAEVCGVSIPTVSEQIKRLEELLETPLFYRRPRRLELTPEGGTLYVYASQMFEAGLRFLDTVSPNAIGGYPVRVHVQKSVCDDLNTEFLLQYSRVYEPFGVVNMHQAPTAAAVELAIERGEADWGWIWDAPQNAQLLSHPVVNTDIVLAVASSRFQPDQVLQVFQDMPVAILSGDRRLRAWIQQILEPREVVVEEWVESDSADFCWQLGASGQAIVPISRSRLTAGGSMREIPLGPGLRVTGYAIWSPLHQKMVAIKKLSELLVDPGSQALSDARREAVVELPH